MVMTVRMTVPVSIMVMGVVMFVSVTVFFGVRMGVGMAVVRMIVAATISMGMFVRICLMGSVFVSMGVGLMRMPVRVTIMLMLAGFAVSCALVNTELHAFDFRTFFTFKMHVKFAQIQLGKLPLQRRGFHSQIAQRADCHVAAYSRKTI
jgi:hypothetical protein